MVYYLGRRPQGDWVVFRSKAQPIRETHGERFTSSIGAFKSRVAARWYHRYERERPSRHTSLSFLLGMGMPVNAVQRRAGHSRASVTTDVYGHSLDRSQEEAAEVIEEMVRPIAVLL
jgi:integrase